MVTSMHTQSLQVIVWRSEESVLEALVGPATYGYGLGGGKPQRNPQWVDFQGEAQEITEEEASVRHAHGLPVATVHLTRYRPAPGLGIAAGRSFATPPIHEGTYVFFKEVTAWRGDCPDLPAQGLPHANWYYALTGALVKTPERW